MPAQNFGLAKKSSLEELVSAVRLCDGPNLDFDLSPLMLQEEFLAMDD